MDHHPGVTWGDRLRHSSRGCDVRRPCQLSFFVRRPGRVFLGGGMSYERNVHFGVGKLTNGFQETCQRLFVRYIVMLIV